MSEIETGPRREDLLKVSLGDPQAIERVASAAPAWNATLRTTCVATLLEGGHAMNALPQLAAVVNCRVLPEDSPQSVEETLRKVIADDQVAVKALGEFERAPASPLRPDVFDATSRVTSQMWPGVRVVPTMVMGATDGRSVRIRPMASRASSSIATTSASTAATNVSSFSPFVKDKPFSTTWSKR
jgi:acetylornithine deacetylase/succinyl-diaminopimelate desuccinylase-like protein